MSDEMVERAYRVTYARAVSKDEHGFAQPPIVRCPKCGGAHGFTDSPRYRELGHEGRGVLEWECTRCGYTIQTPTLDETKA